MAAAQSETEGCRKEEMFLLGHISPHLMCAVSTHQKGFCLIFRLKGVQTEFRSRLLGVYYCFLPAVPERSKVNALLIFSTTAVWKLKLSSMMPGSGLGSQEEVYRSVFPMRSSCSGQGRGEAAQSKSCEQVSAWFYKSVVRLMLLKSSSEKAGQWSFLVHSCKYRKHGNCEIRRGNESGMTNKTPALGSQTQLSMPHNHNITEASLKLDHVVKQKVFPSPSVELINK